MTLADLTSAQAVEKAVDEFNRLGRETFLDKYGFGRAREYFLEIDGKRYDSKAIVGAAHGFQFPSEGALRPSDFSGGDATVRVKLESLGFNVLVLADGTQPALPRDNALERAFHQRMIDIYKTAKADANYNAARFLSMVNDHGGLETARILLRASGVSDGYAALWERQRLDLTVEAVILEDEWHALFDDNERATAVHRLKQYGYTGRMPDV